MRRILVATAATLALGAGIVAAVVTRGGGEPGRCDQPPAGEQGSGAERASGVPAIDWSSPAALPDPAFEEYRSEFVSHEEGWRFFPRSSAAEPGVAYRFDTGHCGLDYLADFDGSFWRPLDPNGGRREPDFFINQDVGAIVLVGPDDAVYLSSTGVEVRLARIDGGVTTFGCD